jgi:hypothetical protein
MTHDLSERTRKETSSPSINEQSTEDVLSHTEPHTSSSDPPLHVLNASQVLHLQSSLGNQHVSRILDRSDRSDSRGNVLVQMQDIAGPGIRSEHGKIPASAASSMVQRAVQVQIIWALPGTPGFLPKTVHITEVSGRPNGPQNDHTAAYVLFAWEVRNAVEGKTYDDALQSLQPVVENLVDLPGFNRGTAAEIATRTATKDTLWNDIDNEAVHPNDEIYHGQILARFMERYIELRNSLELSAIVGLPGGSGKHEGAGATAIDTFIRNNHGVNPLPQVDVDYLSYNMWQTWDYRPTINPTTQNGVLRTAKIFAQWYIQVYRSYPLMPEAWSLAILTELYTDWHASESVQWGWTAAQRTLFETTANDIIDDTELHH